MNDTIAAVATAPGVGAVSILRLSGGAAVSIAEKVFRGRRPLSEAQSHLMLYGGAAAGGRLIDKCLCVVMRAPRSFTGEDVVEFHCHGGGTGAAQILDALISAGARAAHPGEFSKRAFLNGKLDLAEAEAISDIIGAQTPAAHFAAVNQLGGALSEKIDRLRSAILGILARIGVSSDYPEEHIDPPETEQMLGGISEIVRELGALLKTADAGRLLRQGAALAIIGKPNTGKSSLLNYLLGERRAIVTAHAGTTRDVIEESIDLFGIPLRLADTAGIRKGAGEIEGLGIELSKKYLESADVCVLVLDGARPLDDDDSELLELVKGRRHLACINKSDLPAAFGDIDGAIRISAKTGAGVEELLKRVYSLLLSGGDIGAPDLAINLRQKGAILEAEDALKRAADTLGLGFPADIISVDLEEALAALGEVTGQSVSDEVVEKIFSSFCLGK